MSTAAETLLDQLSRDLVKPLETFARDLLVLIKTFPVYPEGHPAPRRVAERLAQWSPTGTGAEFALGVTPTKLLIENQFIGWEGSRIEALATLLHGRKVMRLSWGPRVLPDEVIAFAATLSTSRATGQELSDRLLSSGVYTIGVDPLDVSKIHGALSVYGREEAPTASAQARELDAWLWLQDDAVHPEDLLRVLRSDTLWELNEGDPGFPVRLLFQHGRKLDQALALLTPADRDKVRDRLKTAGEQLAPTDLASIILSSVRKGRAEGEALSCLVGKLSSEELVELMAGVVALGEGASPRVFAAFRSLAPGIDPEQMLSLVETRLTHDENQVYAAEIWRNLKTLLLDLEEGGFFGDDYLFELEHMSEGAATEGDRRSAEYSEDPERHLDWVHFGLAAAQGDGGAPQLFRRLQARLHLLSTPELVELVYATNRSIPSLFRSEPEFTREVFSKVIAGVRVLDISERQAAVEFAQSHEDLVLNVSISALLRERRIATRRFLVDVLSALSPATTGALVARALKAPWYYVRNVATVLGRRRETSSAQVLEALLDYPHEKVRKEALKGLGRMSGAARHAIQRFAKDTSRRSEERLFAERILGRKKVNP